MRVFGTRAGVRMGPVFSVFFYFFGSYYFGFDACSLAGARPARVGLDGAKSVVGAGEMGFEGSPWGAKSAVALSGLKLCRKIDSRRAGE